MALIKCPECGHSISEFADKCISCGCPMDKIKELMGKSTSAQAKATANVSNSDAYQSLKENDKVLVNELCDFIENNTQLIKIDHSKTFGFRKKGGNKMIVVFRCSDRILYISFRGQTDLSSNKIRITSSNLSTIKEAIERNYGVKKTLAKPIAVTPKLTTEPDKKEKPETFTSTRKDYDNYLISTFEQKLKLKIDNLIIKNNPYMYTFRISKNGELFTLCWFSNGDGNKLAFKFYLRPLEREFQKVQYPNSKDVDLLVDMIYKIYTNISYYKQTYTNEKEDPITPVKHVPEKTPVLYSLIVKAVSDKQLNGNDDLTKVSNEVKAFVYSEIMRNGIEQKYFRTEDEFNRYKFSWRFVPNFFGYSFSMRNITTKDAKVFYSYYKAIKLIGIIKKYENIYKKEIVHSYLSVLSDYQKMLYDGEISYSSSNGLTSSFGLVPMEVLDNCLDKLNVLEEIY